MTDTERADLVTDAAMTLLYEIGRDDFAAAARQVVKLHVLLNRYLTAAPLPAPVTTEAPPQHWTEKVEKGTE